MENSRKVSPFREFFCVLPGKTVPGPRLQSSLQNRGGRAARRWGPGGRKPTGRRVAPGGEEYPPGAIPCRVGSAGRRAPPGRPRCKVGSAGRTASRGEASIGSAPPPWARAPPDRDGALAGAALAGSPLPSPGAARREMRPAGAPGERLPGRISAARRDANRGSAPTARSPTGGVPAGIPAGPGPQTAKTRAAP